MTNTTNLHPSLTDSYEMEGYVNRELSDREADRMIRQHGAEPTDTRGWWLFDMLAYLGY